MVVCPVQCSDENRLRLRARNDKIVSIGIPTTTKPPTQGRDKRDGNPPGFQLHCPQNLFAGVESPIPPPIRPVAGLA